MFRLYHQSPYAPVRDAFVELINLIYLVSWKLKNVEKCADEDDATRNLLDITTKELREKYEIILMM